MNRNLFRRYIVSLASVALVTIGFTPVSYADIVSTSTLIESESRAESLREIELFLARDEVKEQFLALGVSPETVTARVNSLTAAELSDLQSSIDEQAAGGDALAVIGTVFLVLLILELLGVTNIFNAI
jgi:hypothetical protein